MGWGGKWLWGGNGYGGEMTKGKNFMGGGNGKNSMGGGEWLWGEMTRHMAIIIMSVVLLHCHFTAKGLCFDSD